MVADDYITKPFYLGEVIARVATNLRRSHRTIQTEKQLQYRDMILDSNTKRISVNGIVLELTAKEYMILELLIREKGKVFSKSNLYESIRSKLKKANEKEEYIETVWGLGYRLYKE